MARLLENLSKELVKESGVSVPRFAVAKNKEEAEQLFTEFDGEVVLKALVPVGKRGKAGAVKFAATAQEAGEQVSELLGMTVRNYPVEEVLVEEKIDIARELYLSITIDKVVKQPVIIACTEGGIDIEEINQKYPEKVLAYHVDPIRGLESYQAKEIWSGLGVKGKELQMLTGVTSRLYKVFDKFDAYLLEINPLVITESGNVMAAAVVMAVDDSALYRHPSLSGRVQMGTERAWRPLTELEKQMVAVNESEPYRGTARYTEMDGGDIGFMCGGGGGSLLLFDALVNAGGSPANYSEFGGNPSAEKVYGLTKGILSKPGVRGLFVAQNITNNTQVDLVALGVTRALREMNIDPQKFPVVVREAGVNETEAREIFAKACVEYYGDEITMTQAARRMVEKMKKTYAGN